MLTVREFLFRHVWAGDTDAATCDVHKMSAADVIESVMTKYADGCYGHAAVDVTFQQQSACVRLRDNTGNLTVEQTITKVRENFKIRNRYAIDDA